MANQDTFNRQSDQIGRIFFPVGAFFCGKKSPKKMANFRAIFWGEAQTISISGEGDSYGRYELHGCITVSAHSDNLIILFP